MEKEIVEYIVVRAKSEPELIDAVNAKLNRISSHIKECQLHTPLREFFFIKHR